MLRRIFEEVRIRGQLDLKDEISLRDVLPIVYSGESSAKNSITYYNSGGRSILFDRGGNIFRVKGIDPLGYLTERVALSEKNRIQNVRDAYEIMIQQLSGNAKRRDLKFNLEKPFGTFFLEQAECEIRALERLNSMYGKFGIESPYEPLFYKKTGAEKDGRATYQTAFKLPNLEADVRTYEIMALLTERLDQCTSDEIAAKSKNICRLFGRLIYWAGVNTGIFASSGVLPIASSFHPQNWVLNKYKGGYGIFRVDHTSTKLTDANEVIRELTRDQEGLPPMLNEFSVYPSRVQMAADPNRFLPDDKRKLKFSEILNLRGISTVDESSIIKVHKRAFGMGLASFLEEDLQPIPEEMFLEALA